MEITVLQRRQSTTATTTSLHSTTAADHSSPLISLGTDSSPIPSNVATYGSPDTKETSSAEAPNTSTTEEQITDETGSKWKEKRERMKLH